MSEMLAASFKLEEKYVTCYLDEHISSDNVCIVGMSLEKADFHKIVLESSNASSLLDHDSLLEKDLSCLLPASLVSAHRNICDPNRLKGSLVIKGA